MNEITNLLIPNDAAPFTKMKVNGDKQCQIPLTTVHIPALYFRLYDALLCEENICIYVIICCLRTLCEE